MNGLYGNSSCAVNEDVGAVLGGQATIQKGGRARQDNKSKRRTGKIRFREWVCFEK